MLNTAVNGATLSFDWPAIEVGINSDEEGPTGLRVIRFLKRASAVADVRGGSPGTVNPGRWEQKGIKINPGK